MIVRHACGTPVSKMTPKLWGGVPSSISPQYCTVERAPQACSWLCGASALVVPVDHRNPRKPPPQASARSLSVGRARASARRCRVQHPVGPLAIAPWRCSKLLSSSSTPVRRGSSSEPQEQARWLHPGGPAGRGAGLGAAAAPGARDAASCGARRHELRAGAGALTRPGRPPGSAAEPPSLHCPICTARWG